MLAYKWLELAKCNKGPLIKVIASRGTKLEKLPNYTVTLTAKAVHKLCSKTSDIEWTDIELVHTLLGHIMHSDEPFKAC